MASKRTRANKPEMIHCPYCGEDYSSTYKHCPFCDEVEPAEDDYQTDEYDEAPRSRGGKRLVTNTRGGGYGGGSSPLKIIGTVVSLALIVAAVIIVITIIRPLVAKGDVDGPADNTTPVESVTPTPDASPSETEPAGESTPPVAETPGDTIPVGQTATGFTLSKSEFTLSDKWPNPITLTVTFIPDGSAGKITWSSSDPEVVSVDENGKVSHHGRRRHPDLSGSQLRHLRRILLQRERLRRLRRPVPQPDGLHPGGRTGLPGEGERHLLHPYLEHRQHRRGHRLRRWHRQARGQGPNHPHLHRGRQDSNLHRALQLNLNSGMALVPCRSACRNSRFDRLLDFLNPLNGSKSRLIQREREP